MTLHNAMLEACSEVQIEPPQRATPGKWVHCPVVGKKRTNGSGRVLVFEDCTGGIAWNWSTGQKSRFSVDGAEASDRGAHIERKRQRDLEHQEVAAICEGIVRACRMEKHPYLTSKGFPDEVGLVTDDPRMALPSGDVAWRISRALPHSDEPVLVVPGRIGRSVTTLQFITANGDKKNILGGKMGGAAHRIAQGREAWVCEGIATALSVRAALRLLGRSATVLSAFSAQNVCAVAKNLRGAVVAADHDKPVEVFRGLGTGEHWARESGCKWTQPAQPGDFNDMHQAHGLRAVALHLRGV